MGKHVPRPAALNIPLPKAGGGFLDPGHLLGAKLDLVFETALFELEQQLIPSAHLMLVENILDGRITDLDPFKGQAVAQLVASPGGMFQAKSQDPLYLLGRCGERVRFGNGRKILQALNAVGLKPALVPVKLG